jgi:putative transposase
LEKRRKRAIKLLKQGLMPVEVAARLGVDRRSVRRWKAAYRAKGDKGIERKPVPGRPARLEPKEKKRLEKVLLKGAKAAGFATDLWTCPRIAKVIKERFGVSYHVDHVCRLLHTMGWSPQRPARVAVERDEARIAQWIREDWPRAKKKPGR